MDKQAAMKRLDAIEREAKELRAIIDRPQLRYDKTKLYVGVKDGEPYIMVGYNSEPYFRFHTFGGLGKTQNGWCEPKKTGQECLDCHQNKGFEIREFTDTKEALEYFLSFL